MSEPRRGGARFRVRFDELASAEDVRHATRAGREVVRDARGRLEHEGTDVNARLSEMPDLLLAYRAFGVAHPHTPGNARAARSHTQSRELRFSCINAILAA